MKIIVTACPATPCLPRRLVTRTPGHSQIRAWDPRQTAAANLARAAREAATDVGFTEDDRLVTREAPVLQPTGSLTAEFFV